MRFTCRRFTAWIATFAILLAALAPTLAQALAAGSDRAAPWSEICTATGVPPNAEMPPGDHRQTEHGIKHCPWCAGSNHPYGLVSPNYALPVGGGTQTSPADSPRDPPNRIKHRGTPQPRAPPGRS